MSTPTIPLPHFGRRRLFAGALGLGAIAGLNACGGTSNSGAAPRL